ncbi:MAG: NADPH-dependent FMN reductase [Candidatus Phlomobacter fragariae]
MQDFKQQIVDADGIIFVTTEYNRSILGVFKNALDQVSRSYGKNV